MLEVGTAELVVIASIILIIIIFVRARKIVIMLVRGWRMVIFVSDKVRVHFMHIEKDQRRE